MILKTPFGDREMFSGAFDSSVPIPRPSQWGGALSYSGRRVTLSEAVGLPAFMRAIRLICETTAGMPMVVSQGQIPEKKVLPQADQLEVLRKPNLDMTPFQVWSFAYASLLRGNAYFWKVKVRGKVVALYPLVPTLVRMKRNEGGITYEIRKLPGGPVIREVTKAEIIDIPGIVLEDPLVGVSLVEALRNGIGTSLARQEFEGRYLANDGQPGVVLKHPESPTLSQRNELRDSFESRHGGVGSAGRPAMMWGGWSIDRIAVSLSDAEFIAAQRFAVQDIARMTGVPSGMLDEPPLKSVATTPETENMRFLTYGLAPWQARLCQGLAADEDLFPGSDWNVEHNHDELLKPDMKTRYEGHRLSRQGGWRTPNEIRQAEGLEPIEGGDVLQETPVGGAPNPGEEAAPQTAALA
jgi:HK97 family phage portal protein